MNLKTMRKIYLNTYFRVPLKIVLCFTMMKCIHDFFSYFCIGRQLKVPRFMNIFGAQNPLNPPFVMPYPYIDTYQILKKNKEYYATLGNLFHVYQRCQAKRQFIHGDQPCRQNPDSVDNFVLYGNIYRIHQTMKYTFLNKMKKQGIQIPEGINQKLRQLHQYRVDCITPITPLL